jgi:hypothetical protein
VTGKSDEAGETTAHLKGDRASASQSVPSEYAGGSKIQ